MRDVAEKALLACHVGFEPGGHAVDGFAEFPKFVAAARRDAGVEAAVGDLFGGGGELADRPGDAADQREPEEDGERENAAGGKQPRLKIEKPEQRPQ